jgi:hypothetical protein
VGRGGALDSAGAVSGNAVGTVGAPLDPISIGALAVLGSNRAAVSEGRGRPVESLPSRGAATSAVPETCLQDVIDPIALAKAIPTNAAKVSAPRR